MVFFSTGGGRDKGGAVFVETVPCGSASVGRHPMTGRQITGRTVTEVSAAVSQTLASEPSTAASRPAIATAVPSSVNGPCPVVDGTTDIARLRNRQAQLNKDIRKLEEWRRN